MQALTLQSRTIDGILTKTWRDSHTYQNFLKEWFEYIFL